MNNNLFKILFQFVGLILLQVVVFDNIHLFGYVNPYIYIAWILLYPLKSERGLFLILSFIMGLSIDFFSNSGGINAASLLFIAYIRLPLLTSLLRKVDLDYLLFNVSSMPFTKLLSYISILVLSHHIILFSLEYFSFSNIEIILKHTVLSGIFTIVLLFISVQLFSPRK
ncbi:MAG: rod shape-determining protein MreD [Flavobacteriaceae bacterium]|nr:MAG: rod shape-determining protein MreD [Flavobacteriaceae bacterium]